MKTLARRLVAIALASAVLPSTAQTPPPIKVGFAVAESGWMTAYDGPPLKAAMLRIVSSEKPSFWPSCMRSSRSSALAW